MPQQSMPNLTHLDSEDIKESFALTVREALRNEVATRERIARIAFVEPSTVNAWLKAGGTTPGFETICRVLNYLSAWQRFVCLLNNRDSSLEDNLALAEAALLGARERLAHHPNSQEREAALARLGNLIRIAGEVITQLGQSATVTDMAERRVPRP